MTTETTEGMMGKRAAYLLIGVGLIACGILVFDPLMRYGLPRLPTEGAPLPMFTERPDLMLPDFALVVACGAGAQFVNLALLPRASPPQHIISGILFVGILVSSMFVGACGIIGWNSWAQHAFPGDGIGLLPVMPRVLQTFFGFLVALGAIIYLYLYFGQIDVFVVFDDIDRSMQ